VHNNTQPTGTIFAPDVFILLLPITLAVFVGFFTFGLPMPVLPVHVHDTLGMSAFVVGLTVGTQFFVALLVRSWTGTMADTRGAKLTMSGGIVAAGLSGAAYLVSTWFVEQPALSLGILLIGRICHGFAESLIGTGALSWGMTLVGPKHAGRVMVWVGIAMFAAYAVAAPAGQMIYEAFDFAGIAMAGMLAATLALAIVLGRPTPAILAVKRTPLKEVFNAVWLPGLGLALSSIGFGVITAFIALLFAAKDWANPALAFTALGVAFIVARLFFGHLPDQLGGAKVALISVAVEAVGQVLIWTAASPLLAYAGAALTGFGFSLAFPAFGVEAVRRAPPQSRGTAMGIYVAFLDLSLGLCVPAAGIIASRTHISSVYLASAVAVICAVIVAARLLRTPAAA
jgi:MFS family permease